MLAASCNEATHAMTTDQDLIQSLNEALAHAKGDAAAVVHDRAQPATNPQMENPPPGYDGGFMVELSGVEPLTS